jgi:hypothetical protein
VTIEKRTLVSMKDIVAMEYVCPHCQGRHSVRVEYLDRLVHKCPNCNELLIKTAAISEPDEAVIRKFIDSLKELQQRDVGTILRLEIAGLTDSSKQS